ncbi:uncharacterized protein [Euwallacea fornicatus]|uniref:uncharacterized protein isoform X2 n=1 Tax=Euwallacea fornicatus TaxID=995702 RepID=UPI00338F0FCC
MEKKVVVESIHEPLPESAFCESSGCQTLKKLNRPHGTLKSSFGERPLVTDSRNSTTPYRTATVTSSTSSTGEQVARVAPQWTAVNWKGPPLKLQRTSAVRHTSLCPAMSFEDVPNIKENQGPSNVSKTVQPLGLHANLKRKIYAQCLTANSSKTPKYLKVYKKNLKPKLDVPMKNAPCSSSVENYIKMDTLEKGAEVLDHLDDASYSGLIKNVMDVTNARHGDYLEKGLKTYLGEKMYMQIASSTLELDPPIGPLRPNNLSSLNKSLLTSSKSLQNSNIKQLSNKSPLKQDSSTKLIGNTNIVLNPRSLQIKAKGMLNFLNMDRCSLSAAKDAASSPMINGILDEDSAINENRFVEVDKIIADKISWMRDHNYSNNETVSFKTPDFDPLMPENILESLEVMMEDGKLTASIEELEALTFESDQMLEIQILNSHESSITTPQILDASDVQQPLKQLNENPKSVFKAKIFKESTGDIGDQDREQRKLELLLKRVQRESLGERTEDTCLPTVKRQDEPCVPGIEATNIVGQIHKEIPSTKEFYISNNTKNIRMKVPSKNGEINLSSNISASKLKKEQPGKESFPAKMIKYPSHVRHEQVASLKCFEIKPIDHKEKQETEDKTYRFTGPLRLTTENSTETSNGNQTDTTQKTIQSDQTGGAAVKFTSPEVASCKMQNLRRSVLKHLHKSSPTAIKAQDVHENSESKDWELEIKQNRVEVLQSVRNDTTKRSDSWQKEYLQRLLILGDLEPNTSENTRQKDLEPLEKDLRVINVELGPPMEVDSIMQMSGKNSSLGRDPAVCQASDAPDEITAKDQGNTVCVLLMEKPPPPDFTIAGKEIVGSKVEIKAIVCKLEQPLEVENPLSDNSSPTKKQISLKDFVSTEETDSSGTQGKIVEFNIKQPVNLKVSPSNVSPGVLESTCQRHVVNTRKIATTIDENEREVDGHFELPFEVKVPPACLDNPEKILRGSVKTNKAAIPFEIHRKVATSTLEPTLEVKASLSQENIADKVITNLPFETNEKKINCNPELLLEEPPNILHSREKGSHLNFVKSDKATCRLKPKVSTPGNSLNLLDNVPPKSRVKIGKPELPREINGNMIGSKLEVFDVEVPRLENCLCNLKKMPQSNVIETNKLELRLDDKAHFSDSSLTKKNWLGKGRTELPSEINMNLMESQFDALEVKLVSSENTLHSLENMPPENFIAADKSKLLLPEQSLNFLENCANAKKLGLFIEADAKIPEGNLELLPDVKASALDNPLTITITTPEKVSTKAKTGKEKSKTCKESNSPTPNPSMKRTATQKRRNDVEQSMGKLSKLLDSSEDIKELRLKGSIRNNLFESFAQKLTPAVHNGKSVNDLAQLLMDFQQSSFGNYLEEKCTIYSTISGEKEHVRVYAKKTSGHLDANSNDEICENGKVRAADLPKLPPTQQVSEEVMKKFGKAKMPEKQLEAVREGDEKTSSSKNLKRQRARKLFIQNRRNVLKQQASKLTSRIQIRIKRVQRKYRQFKIFVRRINSWLAMSSMESFYLQEKVQHLRHISRVVDKTVIAFKTRDVAKFEAKFRRMSVVLSGRKMYIPAKVNRSIRRVSGKNQNGPVLEEKLTEDSETLKSASGDSLGESLVKRQLKMYINRKKRGQVAADCLSDQMSKASHSNCVIDAAPASPASVVIDKPLMDQLLPVLPRPLFALEQVQDQTAGHGLKTDVRESEALRNTTKRRRKGQRTPVSHRYSLRSSASSIGKHLHESIECCVFIHMQCD